MSWHLEVLTVYYIRKSSRLKNILSSCEWSPACWTLMNELISVLLWKRRKDQKISEKLIGIVFFCILNLWVSTTSRFCASSLREPIKACLDEAELNDCHAGFSQPTLTCFVCKRVSFSLNLEFKSTVNWLMTVEEITNCYFIIGVK